MALRYPIANFPRFVESIRQLDGFLVLGSSLAGAGRGRYCIVSALPCAHWTLRAGETGLAPALKRAFPNRVNAGAEPLGHDPDQSPFRSGLIGVLFYEAGYQLLPRLSQPALAPHTPLYWVGDYRWSAVYDHQTGSASLYIGADCPQLTAEQILAALERTPSANESQPFKLESPFVANSDRATYCRKVARIQTYLGAGDCYQVNLSQHFQAQFNGDTWAIFSHLCAVQPSPYAAYLNTPFGTIISLSPEQFIGIRDRRVITRPIKGTRPRGETKKQDKALSQALLESEKDRAENLMIVDLLRNDLGRFCVPGSIRVPALFQLESYANVHHLVSTIQGKLDTHWHPWEVLTGCFPGGSITGAPKVRAMQIIRELETHQRGPYCGSIFYLGDDGSMDSSIAIRTLMAENGRLHCWGGGGVVMDSDAEAEYQESIVKVRRLMHQIESLGST